MTLAEPNQLKTLQQLQNRYVVMRHGQSLANQRGVVISAARNGVVNCGLSEEGKTQVQQSVTGTSLLNKETLVYSSDFKRARETAEIVRGVLVSNAAVSGVPQLRERNFGEYELGSDKIYQQVWTADAEDPSHENSKVESANAVTLRVTGFVLELEKQHRGKQILMVAHGDVLQLLQAAFLGLPASLHRNIQHLDTAEIRTLSLVVAGEQVSVS